MAQWGNTDDAANSVLWGVSNYNKVANTANKTAFFGNTTVGAFVDKAAVGQFGVDTTEIRVSNTIGIAHAGWVSRTVGTGSVLTIGYTGTATGYNNTDVITVASPAAGGNAAATVSTNSTGGALAITITNAGYGFFNVNAAANVSIANSTGGSSAGSGATFTATVGGRAGRVQFESLVAMSSLTGDANDDAILPDS